MNRPSCHPGSGHEEAGDRPFRRVDSAASLGIIELANQPLTFPGCVGNPQSYPYPVLFETAKDAYVSRIVAADPALNDSYCEAAGRLKSRGAKAIISSCGFAVLYQQAVAAQLDLPVLLSPLSLLPLLLNTTPATMKVAVLTYDARQLDERFLCAAGVRREETGRIVIKGIEESSSWRALAAAQPELQFTQLRRDVLVIAKQAVLVIAKQAVLPAGSIGAILLECSAFCPFAGEIRAQTGLPVSDIHIAADMVMSAARGRG